MNKVVNNVRS